MILGRGEAQTTTAIVEEYWHYLQAYLQLESAVIHQRLRDVPGVMERRIGKPLDQWRDEEIIALYRGRRKSTRYGYSAFMAFLLFRGYRQATLHLLTTLPLHLTRHFRPALAPHRQRLQQTQTDLHYALSSVGSELKLLIYLLAVVGKPLSEVSRPDFDTFRDDYQAWYRAQKRRSDGQPDARLTRLETYLVHWEVIPPAQLTFRHQQHFAQLRHQPIRGAIVTYLQWAEIKYQPSTIHSRRAGLLSFFLWFQATYPDSDQLDQVTRPVALAYAQTLKEQMTAGTYSTHYISDLYRSMRLFFEFVIEERLATSPDRNPFGHSDLPPRSDPVPRYLADHEVRTLMTHCHNNNNNTDDLTALKERTLVITLLHTGIRAAELAALQTSHIVQIQDKWKLHIHQGKGLKDRLIPLTPQCLQVLQTWQAHGWERVNDYLFTRHGKPWRNGATVCAIIHALGHKLAIPNLTPHRFRHTFAVALLNYGMRESALQKLMGHTTLNMTLEYARILDTTVEQAFNQAVQQMAEGPRSWVPSFLNTDDYTVFVEEDALNWIRLPLGYCRRHPKLHCESDVKCLLCDRFCANPADLPRFQEMHQRFVNLGLSVQADVVRSHIIQLQAQTTNGSSPI